MTPVLRPLVLKLVLIGALTGLSSIPVGAGEPSGAIELQGHRGARGLAPENTLPAFTRALGIGVTTLELDLAITADGNVVVSHNPALAAALTRGPDGDWLTGSGPAISSLTLRELRRFDVGRINPASRYARRFPKQKAADGARIPTLAEVVALTRRAGNDSVRFNVETKIFPERPALTRAPQAFVDTVLGVLRREGVLDRTTIQSFDWRSLQAVQTRAPSVPTVYLSAEQRWLDNIQRGRPGPSPWTAGFDIDAYGGSVARMVKAAGGAVWSPYHKEINAQELREAHELGLEVIVWTVNRAARMNALLDMGVDGIITDYPDRLRRVMAARNLPLPAPTPIPPQ